MAKRKQYSIEYKSKVALAAIRGDGTIAELSQKYSIHANMIVKWKREALDGVKETFTRKSKSKDVGQEADIKTLQAKIGELIVERDFLAKSLRSISITRRREMIAARHKDLSLTRQCQLLSISRSGLYYEALGESALNLSLMRRLDEQHLNTPWYGSRQMARYLRRQGYCVSRKRIRRLMRKMGLVALAPGPHTSRRNKSHAVFPYLLRNLAVTRANQVWCVDITFIPMAHGFLYLVAIMDWKTRHVLSWRLSTTQDTEMCLEALEDAIERYGKPEIFNTDQGSQFTSADWIGALESRGIRISMDGKGSWMDNVFIERLWRSLKYECVYLNAFDSFKEAQAGISNWMHYYNNERPHSSLGDKTPGETYLEMAA